RITPSVAEQEGQQTETEATGAPQKHHYTLNQQVGSITQAVKKRQYVTPITSKCFFDVTKSAFVCYSERYRAFMSLNESVRG
ncbi:hypothetical protein M2C08_24680, partial [Klebsiella pneumoniae]|nr:hypothetical protein [Klebsiella pneumoniae]